MALLSPHPLHFALASPLIMLSGLFLGSARRTWEVGTERGSIDMASHARSTPLHIYLASLFHTASVYLSIDRWINIISNSSCPGPRRDILINHADVVALPRGVVDYLLGAHCRIVPVLVSKIKVVSFTYIIRFVEAVNEGAKPGLPVARRCCKKVTLACV